MPEFVCIGIDGGGTRTRGVLVCGEEKLAEAETGATRVSAVGLVESTERLLNLIKDLSFAAKVKPSEIDAVAIGLAGVWLPYERKRSEQLLRILSRDRKIEFDELIVTSDAAIALQGAFGGEQGIVLIAGTGTIAIGKTENDIVRCGGWGIELSDEGSGSWIGREGLTAVARAFDGRGKKTLLAEKLIRLFPTIQPSVPRSLVAAYNEKMFDYASIAPFVMECAQQGDEICLQIVERAVFHLLESVHALYSNYYSNSKKVPISLVGGILESGSLVALRVAEELRKDKRFALTAPLGSPLDGALSMAYSLIQQSEEDA